MDDKDALAEAARLRREGHKHAAAVTVRNVGTRVVIDRQELAALRDFYGRARVRLLTATGSK